MFWRDNSEARAFVTYIMLIMLCGVIGRLFPEAAHIYSALLMGVATFLVFRLFHR